MRLCLFLFFLFQHIRTTNFDVTRQKFSSKITINKSEVDTLASNLMNKVGKVEYNYSEILFKNVIENDWENTKKRMNKVLSLLESKSSFDLIAKKFDENISTTPFSIKSVLFPEKIYCHNYDI